MSIFAKRQTKYKVDRDNFPLSSLQNNQSTKRMQYRGLFFFLTGAFALAAGGRRGSEFIPGTGCGTTNTIKIINGNPTLEEETNGCIYIINEAPFKFRGTATLIW